MNVDNECPVLQRLMRELGLSPLLDSGGSAAHGRIPEDGEIWSSDWIGRWLNCWARGW